MRLFEKIYMVRAHHLVFGALVMLALALLYFYLNQSLSDRWGNIVAGIVAGLFVAIIQFLWGWYDYSQSAVLHTLKIRNVLATRDDFSYYGSLIRNSKHTVEVLGVTASRFLEDFADTDSPREEKKVLIQALQRGVALRILVTRLKYLPRESEAKVEAAQIILQDLKKRFADKVEYGYFDHSPLHVLVRIDNEVVVGPYFPGVRSAHSPAIHIDASSRYAAPYLEYFEREWKDRGKEP